MNKHVKIVLNIIAFQIGWFSCVLMAANNKVETGIVIALVMLLVNFLLAENKTNTLLLLFVVTLLGTAWDSLLTHYGILVFSSGQLLDNLAPIWIVMMWLLFASTLTISFRWLYARYVLALLLGAVFGPLAYQSGAALGAVVIPDVWLGNFVMAAGWAVLMPIIIKLTEKIDALSITQRTAT